MSNSAFGNTQGQDSVLTPDVLRQKRGLKWLIFAAILIALALLAKPLLRYVSGESVRVSELRFSTVTRGDLVREASGMGRVVAARAPSLYAENAGVVRFVTEAGAVVASGAVLAEMDSPELKSRLAQELSTLLALRSEAARQKVANQRATLAKTRELDTTRITATAALREWQRAEAALAVRAISSVDHLRAKDALEASEILVRAAAADLALERESLRLELDNRAALVARQAQAVAELERQVAALKIVAPFAGVVGQLMVPDRSSVAANTAVLSVVDLAALELEVSVSEIYSADLAAGLNAEVELGAARLSAVVRLVSPEIKDGALTVRVRFADTQPADLRQNQRLNVRIQFDERKNVALVDRGAFVDAEGGRFAWQRVGDHLRRVAISTGSFSTEKIEITSGLKVGDVMVNSALPKKVLGDRVNLIE